MDKPKLWVKNVIKNVNPITGFVKFGYFFDCIFRNLNKISLTKMMVLFVYPH